MNNNSYKDWLIIIISSFAVLFIFIFLSVYMFNIANNNGSFDAIKQEANNTKLLDKKVLQNAVIDFSARKINFDELRKNPIHFDDPSI